MEWLSSQKKRPMNNQKIHFIWPFLCHSRPFKLIIDCSSTIKLFICHWLKWITQSKMKEADKRNKTVLGSKKTTKLNWGEDIWTNLFARLISEDDFDFFAVDPRLHGQHGLVDEAGQPLCPHWAGMMESYEGQTVNIGRLGAGVELQSTEVVIALII